MIAPPTPSLVADLLHEAADYITIAGGKALLHLGATNVTQLPYGTKWDHLAQLEHEAAQRWTVVRDRGGCVTDVEIARALRVTELVDVHRLLGMAYEIMDEHDRSYAPPTARTLSHADFFLAT